MKIGVSPLNLSDDEILKRGLGWPFPSPMPKSMTESMLKYGTDSMPENGVKYEQAVIFPPELVKKVADYKSCIFDSVYGQLLSAQIGLCWGHCKNPATFETHGLREVIVALTPLYLALVPNLMEKIVIWQSCGKRIELSDIDFVKLEAGESFVVDAETGHYCPIRPDGPFIAVIILPDGTNEAISEPIKEFSLTAIGKYGLTSANTPEAQIGWNVGVNGPFFMASSY